MIGDGHGNDMMRNMAQNVGMLEHEMELEEGKKVFLRYQEHRSEDNEIIKTGSSQ